MRKFFPVALGLGVLLLAGEASASRALRKQVPYTSADYDGTVDAQAQAQELEQMEAQLTDQDQGDQVAVSRRESRNEGRGSAEQDTDDEDVVDGLDATRVDGSRYDEAAGLAENQADPSGSTEVEASILAKGQALQSQSAGVLAGRTQQQVYRQIPLTDGLYPMPGAATAAPAVTTTTTTTTTFAGADPQVIGQVSNELHGATDNGAPTIQGIQAMIEARVRAVKSCTSSFQRDLAGYMQLGMNVGHKRRQHKACRGALSVIVTEKVACQAMLKSLEVAMYTACNASETLVGNPAQEATVCEQSASTAGTNYLAWLEGNLNYFRQREATIGEAVASCNNATSIYGQKAPMCADIVANETMKATECNIIQKELEATACSSAQTLNASCVTYRHCYDASVEELTVALPNYHAQLEAANRNIRASEKIDCLLRALAQHNDSMAARIACASKPVNMSTQLNLTVPDIPAPDVCPDVPPVPCTTDFIDAMYGDLPVLAPAAPCLSCTA